MPVQDHLDREDLLPLDDLEGIHHVLMDGVALQRQGLGRGAHGELVVGLHGTVRGHSGEERLPSSGVSGEVVGLDGGDDAQPVGVHGHLVDLHGRAVLGCAQVHALRFLRVVAEDPVLQLLVVGTEHERILLGGHVPVGPSGDEVPGGPQVHPLGESVQDLGRGGGAGAVVDDEDDVLASLQELGHGAVSQRVVDGVAYDLVGVGADDVLGVERADVIRIGDLRLLNPVLPVFDINLHLNRIAMTDFPY